jgi:multisubunit Na+/H+ antiporter MnhB subunit
MKKQHVKFSLAMLALALLLTFIYLVYVIQDKRKKSKQKGATLDNSDSTIYYVLCGGVGLLLCGVLYYYVKDYYPSSSQS